MPPVPIRAGNVKARAIYWASFEADDHGMPINQGFGANSLKPGFLHPPGAVGTGEIETAVGRDQHIEARDQAGRVAAAGIIDQALVDDQRSARRKRLMRLRQQHLLGS